MKIRYQTWQRYTRAGSILTIPFAVLLWVRPRFGAWTDSVWYGSLIVIFSFAASGALLAILTRAGVVELTYSDTDKQTTNHKMAEHVAEMEQSQRRGFSDSYYEGLGVTPPKSKGPDYKTAAS